MNRAIAIGLALVAVLVIVFGLWLPAEKRKAEEQRMSDCLTTSKTFIDCLQEEVDRP